MSKASRTKGNSGELEVRRLYEAHGFTVRGLEGAGDHLALLPSKSEPLCGLDVSDVIYNGLKALGVTTAVAARETTVYIKRHYPGLTIFSEVKRAERWCVQEWLRQTWRECPEDALPVLAFRGNRWPWVAAVPLDRLLENVVGRGRRTVVKLAL